MYAENELLFPHHLIPILKNLRTPVWQELVERVLTLPEYHEETLAFMLMMIRLNGCVPCETDSYRAMRGCDACTIQTLRRYKGSDQDLLKLFELAIDEIRQFATLRPSMNIIVEDPLTTQVTA